MGKHRKPARKWAPYIGTGIALNAAALAGFGYAGDGNVVSGAKLMASSIFVDGTKSVTGNELDNPPYRMAQSFQGTYDNGPRNQFTIYPRALGPATGLGDPTYDVSEGLATKDVVERVKLAKAQNPNEKIYVVGYSQGAGATTNAIPILEAQGLTDNVEFVMAANPRRNDGGLLARVPAGVYVPIFGVTFGGGTTSESTKVLQVTKQYDGVGDSPKYVFNVVSDINAAMGFYYLHGDYYKDIDPSADPTRDDRIVTTSADGNVTDVLVLTDDLPLTRPLLQLGVPHDVVKALDPFLRAVIETGYDRPTGPNSYPSEPVPFQLVPPPDKWLGDITSVTAGATQTTQNLTTLGQPAPQSTPGNRIAAATPTVSPSPGPAPAPPVVDVVKKTEVAGDDGANKTEPPKHAAGGWKPGDILRQFLGIKPTGPAGSTTPGATTAPGTPSPGPETKGPADAAKSSTGSPGSSGQ